MDHKGVGDDYLRGGRILRGLSHAAQAATGIRGRDLSSAFARSYGGTSVTGSNGSGVTVRTATPARNPAVTLKTEAARQTRNASSFKFMAAKVVGALSDKQDSFA